MRSPQQQSPISSQRRRLSELQTPFLHLTGLTWEIITQNEEMMLVSAPSRDQHQVDFVSRIFEENLQLNKTDESAQYQVVFDEEEKAWEFVVLSTLLPEDVNRIQKVYRHQQTKHQHERQDADSVKERLTKITGVAWKITEREDCLFAPIYVLSKRHSQHDVVSLFLEQMTQFCLQNQLTPVTLDKTRVQGEPFWQAKISDLSSILSSYYHYRQQQHELERYRAKKLAQRLSQVLDKGICIDVAETYYFSEPIILFAEGAATQLNFLQKILSKHQLLRGQWEYKNDRLSFRADQVSLVHVERFLESKTKEKQDEAVQFAQLQCQLLQTQLQQFIHAENYQLREKILSAVNVTEQRLTQRVDVLEKRVIQSLDQRLEKFETAVTQKLQAQGMQLEAITVMIRRSQEYLIDIHEQQTQQFNTQQAWLKNALTHLQTNIASELATGWQAQMQGWLSRQFDLQEERLQASLSQTTLNQALEDKLKNFQDEFLQTQQAQWQQQQAQFKDYLDNHSAQLSQTHNAMTQEKQQFSALETALLKHAEKLSTHTFEQILPELKQHASASSLNVDWKHFWNQLESLGEGVLNNKTGLQSAIQSLLQQGNQQSAESQAIGYLMNLVSAKPVQNKQESFDINLFIITFERKAKESVQLLESAAQGLESEDGKLGDQLASAAENVADFFSIAIPGLRLIVKATVFGTQKYLAYRQQCFIDRIYDFLVNESLDDLLKHTAEAFSQRYQDQLKQLTLRGIEDFLNHYLIPCLLAEMAKPRENALSTAQKEHCLLLSGQNKTPLLPVKLTTQQSRKQPWTAAGLILGPSAVVDGKHYVRNDNPLRTLPWQPKPHRVYGQRISDAEEIKQNYQLLYTHESSQVLTTGDVSWKNQTLSSHYLLAHVDAWEEQDATTGQTCWQYLATQGSELIQTLTEVLNAIERGHASVTKEQLQSSLCLTDANEQNLLHTYLSTQTNSISELYTQLKRVAQLSLWDQQRDVHGHLPIAIVYQAWQKEPHNIKRQQAFSHTLSMWFASSDLTSLIPLASAYPLTTLLPRLTFTAPIASPIFTLYLQQEKTYLLTLIENNPLRDIDSQGNNLLHCLVNNNESEFFQTVISRLQPDDLSHALSQKNRTGDTPLILAVKLKKLDTLWAMSKDDRIRTQADARWGLSEAYTLAQNDAALLTPIELLNNGQTKSLAKEKKSSKLFGIFKPAMSWNKTKTSVSAVMK